MPEIKEKASLTTEVKELLDVAKKIREIQEIEARIDVVQRRAKDPLNAHSQLEMLNLSRDMKQLTLLALFISSIGLVCGVVQIIIGIASYLKS